MNPAIYVGATFILLTVIWIIANREDGEGLLCELSPPPSPAGVLMWLWIIFAVITTCCFA